MFRVQWLVLGHILIELVDLPLLRLVSNIKSVDVLGLAHLEARLEGRVP
jgi:hypothetical protein